MNPQCDVSRLRTDARARLAIAGDSRARMWQHGRAMASETAILDPGLAERERVVRALREQAPRLRACGITSLSLFGSMARGEAGPDSDVDLLIETEGAAKLGFFELFDLGEDLARRLGRRVQFAFRSEMRPWLRAWIEEDRIGIF
jgi:predicted nucleotidyltransferase